MCISVVVPPTVTPVGEAKVIAFRDNSVTLIFSITKASPDVITEDITWEFQHIQQNDTIIVMASDRHQFLDDHRSLTINDLTTGDSGNYTITASNAAGMESSVITLDVQGTIVGINSSHIVTSD